MKIEEGVPLARLTTIGTGGPAQAFAQPASLGELEEALAWAAERELPVATVGLGSNLLVADVGVDGLVLRLAGDLASVRVEDGRLVAGGGATNAVCLHRARAAGLGGFEFACAIPGTAGGGVWMNAGAYGSDWSEILVRARVVTADGAGWLTPAELGLSYRHSGLRHGEVVAEVEYELVPRPPDEIKAVVAEPAVAQRKATQPTNKRTFGSVFKNPEHELGAGRMLEACGLKGHASGGAVISPRHANFIENAGGATTADALALMAEARRRAARAVRGRARARGAAARRRSPSRRNPLRSGEPGSVAGGRGSRNRSRPRARAAAAAVQLPRTRGGERLELSRIAPSGRSLLVAFLLLVVVVGLYAVARGTSAFAVRTLAVEGAPPEVAAQVRKALAPEVGDSLLSLDLGELADRVERVPTVAAASFDRGYPHTLTISVVPEVPVAVLRQGASSWLVAAHGRVVAELERGALPGLPRIWLKRGLTVVVGESLRGLPRRAVTAVAPLASKPLPFAVNTVLAEPSGLTLRLAVGARAPARGQHRPAPEARGRPARAAVAPRRAGLPRRQPSRPAGRRRRPQLSGRG